LNAQIPSLMSTADTPATRLATRIAFFVNGFSIAAWAPLVPFVKSRLGLSDGTLGLLLLWIGAGSVASMLLTGPLCSRFGSKPIVGVTGFALAVILPTLAFAGTPIAMAVSLFFFGAALGSMDVAMNVHAVAVEKAASRPLMSGFHGMFSVGGFAGAAFMTGLLSLHVQPMRGVLACAGLVLVGMALATPRLIAAVPGEKRGPLFAMPHGFIILLAVLAGVTFLAEGALLDWSAMLVTDTGLVPAAQGGLGYMLFAIAMTVGRFGGDAVVARIGDSAALFRGGLVAVAGFVVLLVAPITAVALGGFLLIGVGASNLVPVLFRRAGAQSAMPPALAVSAITTVGYAGILAGPAVIGFVAQVISLHGAFWVLALLMCLVPVCARRVAPEQS
jgi:predicted MFS family arabinose efflux permease